MIEFTTQYDRYILTRTTYTRKAWKKNHVPYGGNMTPGCWNTVHCKADDTLSERLSKIALRASLLLDVTQQEFRIFFEKTDILGIHVYFDGKTIRFYHASAWHEFNKASKAGFRKYLNRQGWLLDDSRQRAELARLEVGQPGKRKVAKTISLGELKNAARTEARKEQEANLCKKLMEQGMTYQEATEFMLWQGVSRIAQLSIGIQAQIKIFQTARYLPEDYFAWAEKNPTAVANIKKKRRMTHYVVNVLKMDSLAKTLGLPLLTTAETQAITSAEDAAIAPAAAAPEENKTSVLILCNAHVTAWRNREYRRIKRERAITQREGQGRFRSQVLSNHIGCAITGALEGLEAAHIIPDSELHNMHPSNGLALCKWLHTAFDTYMFAINPLTLTIYVEPSVRPFLNIHGKQISDGKYWPLDRSALAYHFETFQEKNKCQLN